MTETKHTPGPWRLTENSIGTLVPGRREWSSVGYAATIPDRDAPEGEGKANAHLMAAAPDLYEALEEYVHAMEGFAEAVRHITGTPYPWPAQEIALPKARAALAKARGEA